MGDAHTLAHMLLIRLTARASTCICNVSHFPVHTLCIYNKAKVKPIHNRVALLFYNL